MYKVLYAHHEMISHFRLKRSVRIYQKSFKHALLAVLGDCTHQKCTAPIYNILRFWFFIQQSLCLALACLNMMVSLQYLIMEFNYHTQTAIAHTNTYKIKLIGLLRICEPLMINCASTYTYRPYMADPIKCIQHNYIAVGQHIVLAYRNV